ncbi:MAG: hypothetical protein RL732_694 [Bacteroidota bacterium]
MGHPDNFGDFFQESKRLIRDYLETQVEIYRLKGVKAVSKVAGFLLWIILLLFLVMLSATFAGIVLGLWLSSVFQSYIIGFGVTTLLILLLILLISAFRRTLFVNPIIKAILKKTQESTALTEEEEEPNL